MYDSLNEAYQFTECNTKNLTHIKKEFFFKDNITTIKFKMVVSDSLF